MALFRARDVCLGAVKTQRAPSRHCWGARVNGTTSAMYEMTTPSSTCSVDHPAVTPTPTQNQTPPPALANPIPGGLASAISILALYSDGAYPMGALDGRRTRSCKATRPYCSGPPHTAIGIHYERRREYHRGKFSRQTTRYSGHCDTCGTSYPFTGRFNPFNYHFVVCLRANRVAQLHGRKTCPPPPFHVVGCDLARQRPTRRHRYRYYHERVLLHLFRCKEKLQRLQGYHFARK